MSRAVSCVATVAVVALIGNAVWYTPWTCVGVLLAALIVWIYASDYFPLEADELLPPTSSIIALALLALVPGLLVSLASGLPMTILTSPGAAVIFPIASIVTLVALFIAGIAVVW